MINRIASSLTDDHVHDCWQRFEHSSFETNEGRAFTVSSEKGASSIEWLTKALGSGVQRAARSSTFTYAQSRKRLSDIAEVCSGPKSL